MYYNLNTHTHTHTLMVNFMGRLDWALSQMPGRGIFAVPSLEQFLHICPCTAESRDFPFMSTWDFFTGCITRMFRAKWWHKVKNCQCYLLEFGGGGCSRQFSQEIVKQVYYSCLPRGSPKTNLFPVQPDHSKIARVSSRKSKLILRLLWPCLALRCLPDETQCPSQYGPIYHSLILPQLSVLSTFPRPPNVHIRSLCTRNLWNLSYESMDSSYRCLP